VAKKGDKAKKGQKEKKRKKKPLSHQNAERRSGRGKPDAKLEGGGTRGECGFLGTFWNKSSAKWGKKITIRSTEVSHLNNCVYAATLTNPGGN